MDIDRPLHSDGDIEPATAPIGRSARSLPDQVAEHLLAAIISGRLAAGTRLKELALAQEHAVSRATIREALIILERRRFIERIPRFGARVTGLGADDVTELFEVRAALLAIAAERCAATNALQIGEALNHLVQEMQGQRTPASDPHRFAELSIKAQHVLLSASGNRYLLELYEQLASLSTWRLIRTRALSFVTMERRCESAGDWLAVVAAIQAQDGPAAAKAARQVLHHSLLGVQVSLSRAAATTPPL